ncbi:hypothetical protein [Bacillus subtilis]|uniref:hypothetical protein n=1 Tax=Bacillus subtilis TaxID=1423 RepID=UPI003D7FFF1E
MQQEKTTAINRVIKRYILLFLVLCACYFVYMGVLGNKFTLIPLIIFIVGSVIGELIRIARIKKIKGGNAPFFI